MAESAKKGMPWKVIAAAVIVVAIFAAWFLLPIKEWLQSFSEWITSLGLWGAVVFAVAYVIAIVILAPAALFTIAAGLVFGLGWGFPVVMVGATVGASLAFLVARYLVRDRVRHMVEARPKFKAVDAAVTEEGWKIVMLLRLSPLVPFNIQNYFFGLTNIDFWHYVLATFVGIIPGVVLYLYIGALGDALAGGAGQWGTAQWIFFAIGLVATVVVALLVARKAKAKLKEAGLAEDVPQSGRANSSKKLARSS
jgi:uncharacterized membrane protein YdjX (TVP38/TMEM64 family)